MSPLARQMVLIDGNSLRICVLLLDLSGTDALFAIAEKREPPCRMRFHPAERLPFQRFPQPRRALTRTFPASHPLRTPSYMHKRPLCGHCASPLQ